ncbi:MAG: radical SAM protein [Candidatus Omnitrophica bacterium]|nr:radical SAM protein [Candidatus Omnitrophota bacterium]
MEDNQRPSFNPSLKVVPVPTFCCFTLCDTCILRCKMCYKWQPDLYIKAQRKQMELSDWKKCAVSLRKIAPDNFVINFGGGEVTTVPWLFEIVSFCRDLGFKTNIATNGFLIDSNMAKQMNISGLDYINISLDSIKEETHDMLRGVKGAYNNAHKAIDLVHEHSPNTQISLCSIMMELTLDGMVELVNWAQGNNKVAMIYLMALMQPNNTQIQSDWYKDKFSALWPKDLVKTSVILDELIELKRKGYKISNKVEHLQAYKTYFMAPDKYVKKSTCNIDRAVHISSVGDVFMCYRYHCLGDVRERDLADTWESSFAKAVRENISNCRENCHFLLNCNFDD